MKVCRPVLQVLPISHQKNVIFTPVLELASKIHTHSKTLLQEFMPLSLRLEQQQKRFLKIHFEFAHFSFFSYSFKLKQLITTFVHSRSSLIENYTRFQTKMCNVYTRFQTKTAQKPNPLRLHTGADPGFFFGRGCTRLLLYFNANKPHSFFCGEYQLY